MSVFCVNITQDMLTSYSQGLITEYSSTEKLASNLNDKITYVLHYESLRLFLQLGMELVQIHRILKISQLGLNLFILFIYGVLKMPSRTNTPGHWYILVK